MNKAVVVTLGVMGLVGLIAVASTSYKAPSDRWQPGIGQSAQAQESLPVMKVDTQLKLELSRLCRAYKNGDAEYQGMNLAAKETRDQLKVSCAYKFE